ncbi:MAG: glycosyl hydrolase family 18 protein [Clostridia bacterium]
MFKEIKRLICPVILIFLIFTIFIGLNYNKDKKIKSDDRQEISNLVVFGENIVTKYSPFIKDEGMYISFDTIQKVIDKDIYYDKVATKVIITTKDDVLKFKISELKMSKNLEYIDIKNPALLINEEPYIDINLVKDIYKIKLEYNNEENILTIDNIKTSDIALKYNRVNVYDDISTRANVLTTLSKINKVTVYNETFNHKRWYKVKTDSGIVGYIAKNNINIEKTQDEDNVQIAQNNEKITMFWQYGSALNTLGNSKIDGVNVVSPTWYELKNSDGEINSKFSQAYFNKAKSFGYKIWPIITNGIDSASYLPSDTSKFLNSEYNREKFIINVLALAKANKLDGINIDFEQMKVEDKDKFTQLIKEMAPLLRKENITLSVDIYFVEYISRKDMGKFSDYVILMGYDQRGGWSNEAGSISEISWVDGKVKSLLEDSKIPHEKIILGVPFYSRMWTQKNGIDVPRSKIYSMQDCLDFVTNNKLTTRLDEKSGQNFAQYLKGSTTYKLWLEDEVSLKSRVDIVNKYKLAGISGWQKALATDNVFKVIKDNLEI